MTHGRFVLDNVTRPSLRDWRIEMSSFPALMVFEK
jgi:hypothetical protein